MSDSLGPGAQAHGEDRGPCPLPTAGWLELLLWAVGRRRRYRVRGRSMEPGLRESDELLVDPRAEVRAGDVVVAQHPFRPGTVLIKRLEAIEPDGRLRVAGDNPAESTDSRSLGALRPEALLGRAVSRLRATR